MYFNHNGGRPKSIMRLDWQPVKQTEAFCIHVTDEKSNMINTASILWSSV